MSLLATIGTGLMSMGKQLLPSIASWGINKLLGGNMAETTGGSEMHGTSTSSGSGHSQAESGVNREENLQDWQAMANYITKSMEGQQKFNRRSMYEQMGYNTAGAIAQGIYNQISNNAAMQYNSAEAAKNRAWQEQMSNTSYQRAMEDMRKAGLNPILAYAQGGASTPGGAQGTITSASMGMPSASAANASALGISQNHNNTWSKQTSDWWNAAQSITDSSSYTYTSADKMFRAMKNIYNTLDNLGEEKNFGGSKGGSFKPNEKFGGSKGGKYK